MFFCTIWVITEDAGPCCDATDQINTAGLPIDGSKGSCSSTQAVGGQFSLRDQFWQTHAKPEMRLSKKIVLHVKI